MGPYLGLPPPRLQYQVLAAAAPRKISITIGSSGGKTAASRAVPLKTYTRFPDGTTEVREAEWVKFGGSDS